MKEKIKFKIFLATKNGWNKFKFLDYQIFYKGFIFGLDKINFKNEIIKNLVKNKNYNFFAKNFGNFTIIAKSTNKCLLLSDSSRSFPIYFSKIDNLVLISDSAKKIIKNKNGKEIDDEMKLLALMSGYTISNYTIFKKVFTVCAGQYILIGNKILKKFYVNFFPNKFVNKNYNQYKKEYISILDNIFKDLKEKIKDKKIYLALSAGDDSRLIACYLKKHNFKNVECFSYGWSHNNWEIKLAKKVSFKLGFKHRTIIVSSEKVKKFFKSNQFNDYFKFYNNFDSVPSIHELYVLKILKNRIKKKSVILNGLTADPINGSLIKRSFLDNKNNLSIVLDEIINKHYSLWPNLKNENNLKKIKKNVLEEYKDYSKIKIKYPYQVLLFHSYQNRICKYLMKNYQVYEHYNFEWYSPYMDLRFVKFWYSVPQKYHFKRNLSKKILKDTNIYKVWNKDFNYKKNNNLNLVTSVSRSFLKMFFIANKKSWKLYDKKFFQYYNDNQLKSHIVSEKEWKNTKNFRSPISFLSAKWLQIKPTNIK